MKKMIAVEKECIEEYTCLAELKSTYRSLGDSGMSPRVGVDVESDDGLCEIINNINEFETELNIPSAA